MESPQEIVVDQEAENRRVEEEKTRRFNLFKIDFSKVQIPDKVDFMNFSNEPII